MKFLPLTAALTLFASPAAAMDYVKCEAMNKAAARVRVSDSQEIRRLRIAYNSGRSDTCQGIYDAARTRCTDAYEAKHLEAHNKAVAEVEADNDARLAQIQADYKAEGCY